MSTSPRTLLFRADLGDLVALHPDPSHQPLLAEDERVDVVLRRRRRQRLRLALVDYGHGRADTDLEAFGLVELPERAGVHEEQRVAVLLRPGLQADRGTS